MPITRNIITALGPFLMDSILMVTGEKGGCGKTTMSISLVDMLIELGIPIHIIELDYGNPEVGKTYKLNLKVIPNIETEAGWREVYERIKKAPANHVVVISTPGSMLARADAHCRSFLNVMPRFEEAFGRPFRVVWVIDNKKDGMEYLAKFYERMPGVKIDVVRNNFFGAPSSFKLFNESKIKKALAERDCKVIDLPEIPGDLAQSMNENRMSRQAFLASLTDMLDQDRYEDWWDRWIEALKGADYVL